MLLSIVIINYNSGEKLHQCVDALMAETSDIETEMIVVNNASEDGSTDFLQDPKYSGFTRILNEIPLGYSFAANQGFIRSKGRYVLFSNPDMIVQEGTVQRMLGHMRGDPSLGAVSGYYLTPDLAFDKYYNRFPSALSLFLGIYLPRAIAARFRSYRRYHMMDVSFAEETEVEQPAGAFMMVDREVFGSEFIGPEFGLMFGDVEAAWKIRLAGRNIKVFKDSPVIHNHVRNTMKRSPDISEEYLYTTDYFVGMSNFFRKNHGIMRFMQVKVLFGLMLALTSLGLFLRELFVLGNPFRVLWYRQRILWNFLIGRNPLYEPARKLSEEGAHFSKSRIIGPFLL